jgi:hypothetical protein
MNFSETIIAAMIGAGATVATATFQLFMAFRARRADSKPKRGSGFRSMLAVLGLVLGAAVAGFGYSELRVQSEREQSRAMEQRISDRLQVLADAQLAQLRNIDLDAATLPAAAISARAPAHSDAIAYVAACRPQAPEFGGDPVGCDAAHSNRVALCAVVPPQASVREVQLFAKADGESSEWEESRVLTDQDIGGARFLGSTYELEQGNGGKSVCAQFLQWSSTRGHVARIVVVYTAGAAMAGSTAPVPAAVAEDSLTPAITPADPVRDAAQAVIAAQP